MIILCAIYTKAFVDEFSRYCPLFTSLFYPTFPIYSPFSIWGIQKQLGTMTFNSVYVKPFIITYPLNDYPFILAEWIV